MKLRVKFLIVRCSYAVISTDYEKTEDWGGGGTQKGDYTCHFFWYNPQTTSAFQPKCFLFCYLHIIFVLMSWTLLICVCNCGSVWSDICVRSTEQKRWTPPEEEKRAPRGHLWGLWCWWRFQIGTFVNIPLGRRTVGEIQSTCFFLVCMFEGSWSSENDVHMMLLSWHITVCAPFPFAGARAG